MRLVATCCALGLAWAACSDDASSPADTTPSDTVGAETEVTPPDTTTAGDGDETQAPEDTAAADDEAAPQAVTFDAVHAFMVVKCAPCHAGPVAATAQGGHNMANPDVAVAYAASQLDSTLAGKTKGALALQYVKAGIMPIGAGCSGDPAADAGLDGCLTAGELELLERWVADGQLPPD